MSLMVADFYDVRIEATDRFPERIYERMPVDQAWRKVKLAIQCGRTAHASACKEASWMKRDVR